MSLTYADGVILTIEAGFGYPWNEAITWTDISAYVRGLETQRGRSSEFGPFSPGTLSLTLDNDDRRFDPNHASGPYYGDLVPMVPVRVTAQYSATTYPVFYGYAQGWPQRYVYDIDSTVTVECVDGMRILENTVFEGSTPYQSELLLDGAICYYLLNERVSDDFWDSTGETGPFPSDVFGTYDWPDSSNHSPWAVLDDPPAAPNSPLYHVDEPEGSTGIYAEYWAGLSGGYGYLETYQAASMPVSPHWLEFWILPTDYYMKIEANGYLPAGAGDAYIRFWWDASTADAAMIKVCDYKTGKVATTTTSTTTFAKHVWSHVIVTFDDNEVVLYINGVEAHSAATTSSTYTDGENQFLAFEGQHNTGNLVTTISHLSAGPSFITAGRAAAHYAASLSRFGGDTGRQRIERMMATAGWPVALSDLDDGVTVLTEYAGASNALAHIREVESAEQGQFFIARDGKLTFRDRQSVLSTTSTETYDDGSNLGFTDVVIDAATVDSVRNIVVVNYATGSVTFKDPVSVRAYGPSAETVDAKVIDEVETAQNLGLFRIESASEPRTRITQLAIAPRHDPANAYPALLGLELGSVITVSLTPVGVGSALTQTLVVSGISHQAGNWDWRSTLYLSPTTDTTGFFVLGDATRGKLGYTDGNVTPY